MSHRDRLFEFPVETVSDFVFDERVVRVFADMIQRSVPGYGLLVPLLGVLARRYAQDDSLLYDLGCSLGAVALTMSQSVRADRIEIVAVDNSPAMIARLREVLDQQKPPPRTMIRTVCQDILDTPIEQASVVVLNFTLQFLDRGARLPLLQRIAEGMLPGGVLLLSEKVDFEQSDQQQLQTTWHHDFKRAQGYSELEISGKRDALENVLVPDTLAAHRRRLQEAGFDRVYPWFQAFNFISVAAFR
jgi:tRNA (cmo5U34)-methyltransferase